jgi:16S rRNA (adenine1518-N6/adenine1519-N6)-dimethyltransferase
VTANSPQLLDTLLKLGFASRRKMLRNNLKGYLDLSQIDLILKELEVSPLSRAEELTLEQWINLSNLVGKI